MKNARHVVILILIALVYLSLVFFAFRFFDNKLRRIDEKLEELNAGLTPSKAVEVWNVNH